MIDRRKRNILITIIVLLGIAFDQISKVWVRNNFESYIDTNDGKFVSRKYYCPSCYKGHVVKADVLSNQGIMKLSI